MTDPSDFKKYLDYANHPITAKAFELLDEYVYDNCHDYLHHNEDNEDNENNDHDCTPPELQNLSACPFLNILWDASTNALYKFSEDKGLVSVEVFDEPFSRNNIGDRVLDNDDFEFWIKELPYSDILENWVAALKFFHIPADCKSSYPDFFSSSNLPGYPNCFGEYHRMPTNILAYDEYGYVDVSGDYRVWQDRLQLDGVSPKYIATLFHEGSNTYDICWCDTLVEARDLCIGHLSNFRGESRYCQEPYHNPYPTPEVGVVKSYRPNLIQEYLNEGWSLQDAQELIESGHGFTHSVVCMVFHDPYDLVEPYDQLTSNYDVEYPLIESLRDHFEYKYYNFRFLWKQQVEGVLLKPSLPDPKPTIPYLPTLNP
jgi:hypothetical protein